MPLTDEIRKSLDPEVLAHLEAVEKSAVDAEAALAKAAGKPHAYSPQGDDGDDDTDCETCGMSQSAGNHFSKSVEPAAPVDPVEAQKVEFEKAMASVPEPVRKFMAEQQRQTAEAQTMAKALFDERENARFAEMAKSLVHLPGVTSEGFGPVLRKAAEAAPPEIFEGLFDVLKAADSALKTSGAFTETGFGGTVEGSGTGGEDQLDGIAKAIAKDEGIEYPEAMAKAVAQNPEMYRQHRRHEIARNNGSEA